MLQAAGPATENDLIIFDTLVNDMNAGSNTNKQSICFEALVRSALEIAPNTALLVLLAGPAWYEGAAGAARQERRHQAIQIAKHFFSSQGFKKSIYSVVIKSI